MTDKEAKTPRVATDAALHAPTTRVVDVRDLLAGAREITLLHANERYRLRVTAQNKLILTK